MNSNNFVYCVEGAENPEKHADTADNVNRGKFVSRADPGNHAGRANNL